MCVFVLVYTLTFENDFVATLITISVHIADGGNHFFSRLYTRYSFLTFNFFLENWKTDYMKSNLAI